MKQINDISEELESMGSFLADMSRKMPYSVPVGYFENSAFNLQETIENLQQPDLVTGWGKTLPYSLPDGYFENLTLDIISATIITGIVESLPKKAPFNVPSAYFESFPENMLLKAQASEPTKKETKQIPFKPLNIFTRVKWAAAAIILICISAGSYITFFGNTPSENPEKILASVPNSDLQSYLQNTYFVDVNRIANNNNIANLQLDNKEIIQYLNETGWDAIE